jgi:hypothetical protein
MGVRGDHASRHHGLGRNKARNGKAKGQQESLRRDGDLHGIFLLDEAPSAMVMPGKAS